MSKGIAYYNLKDYQKAISNFDRQIEINPAVAEAHKFKGMAYCKLNNLQDSILSFNRSILIDHNDA